MSSDALVEVEVQSLGEDRATRSPVVILEERAGGRVLPIWIGAAEASAIAVHLAQVDFPRPLTHDLFVTMLASLSATLDRVIIPRVADGTYHAELVLSVGTRTVTVDARPSDSIAIALRAGAAIYVADDLLRDIDLDLTDAEAELPQPGFIAQPPPPSEAAGTQMSAEELEAHLRKLDPEDFGRFKP